MNYHNPVLLQESVEGLAIKPKGIYVDATFGGGGHSKAILARLGPGGRLIAFDQDRDAASHALQDPRFTLVQHNFRCLHRYLRCLGALPVDGILADLGVSSHQLDTPERGFSIKSQLSLDMRMDRDQDLTAQEALNALEEKKLVDIFSRYGEIHNSKTLARRIVSSRDKKAIETAEELVRIASPLSRGPENRYLAKLFQSLRIYVNDELNALEDLMRLGVRALRPGGRLVILSYHSLEDRIVKQGMRAGVTEADDLKPYYRLISKKPVTPSEEEIKNNPRARSAKLRIAERTAIALARSVSTAYPKLPTPHSKLSPYA